MSSDNNENGDTPRKISEEAMKKLNDAFSSYFDSKESDSNKGNSAEKNTLFEMVQSEITEIQENPAENISAQSSSVPAENREKEAEADNKKEEKDDDSKIIKTPDVFSAVFDDAQYQSVEIEIEEQKPVNEIAEETQVSSKLENILKNKSNVPTVLANEDKTDKEPVFLKQEAKETAAKKPLPEIHVSEVEDDTVISRTFVKKQHKIEVKEENASAAKPAKPEIKKRATADRKEKQADKKKPSVAPENTETQKHATLNLHGKTPSPFEGEAKVALLYNRDHATHDAASLSSHTNEKPERLIKAMWYLEKSRVFTDGTCTLIEDFEMAGEEDLLRVHDGSYVAFVRSYSDAGGGFLGDSTYMSSTSYGIAKKAVGGAIAAGNLLMDKKYTHVFVLTRPPGHHASTKKYGGFCLFNNAAVLARYLQQRRHVGKVLILDWDAHAGDGTMEIFYDDPTVMLISLHRDPHTFYPRKGFSEQDGENQGKGYTMNIEMPEGAGNEEYELAFEEVVIPLITDYQPEFLIVSSGFDAHYYEKSIGLSLDSNGYHYMTTRLLSVFSGPIAFLMEGGYHDFNGQLCHTVLSALHRKSNPISDVQQLSSYKQNIRKQIYEQMQKKVEEAKKNNPVLSSQVLK